MLPRIYLRRVLPGIAVLAVVAFPAVVSAASLRSTPDPWPARHFQSEAGGVQIPFEYTKGHIFVTVSVNGNPGYVFLLDTGTSIDVLDLKASRELGIPIEKIKRAKDLGLGGGKVKMAGARHLELLVGGVVHEDVVVPVAVEELHLVLVDDRLLELLVGPVRALDHRAGADVLQLGPDEGTALARLHVLELHDAEQPLGEVEGHAVLQVVGGEGHFAPRWS